jgi:hypothetical protein
MAKLVLKHKPCIYCGLYVDSTTGRKKYVFGTVVELGTVTIHKYVHVHAEHQLLIKEVKDVVLNVTVEDVQPYTKLISLLSCGGNCVWSSTFAPDEFVRVGDVSDSVKAVFVADINHMATQNSRFLLVRDQKQLHRNVVLCGLRSAKKPRREQAMRACIHACMHAAHNASTKRLYVYIYIYIYTASSPAKSDGMYIAVVEMLPVGLYPEGNPQRDSIWRLWLYVSVRRNPF